MSDIAQHVITHLSGEEIDDQPQAAHADRTENGWSRLAIHLALPPRDGLFALQAGQGQGGIGSGPLFVSDACKPDLRKGSSKWLGTEKYRFR